ncbi:MAG: hypothetical protein ACK5MD_05855 [Flavobacteriales bacterium]
MNITSDKKDNIFIQKIIKDKNNILFQYANDYIPSPKYFEFYSKKDTMKVKCFCNWYNNLIIKDVPFKKGSYELNVIKSIQTKKAEKNKIYPKYKEKLYYEISLNEENVIFEKK